MVVDGAGQPGHCMDIHSSVPINQVVASLAARRTRGSTSEPAAGVQHILNGYLRQLRDGQLPVRAIGSGHDLADPWTGAVARLIAQTPIWRYSFGLWLHGSESGSVRE